MRLAFTISAVIMARSMIISQDVVPPSSPTNLYTVGAGDNDVISDTINRNEITWCFSEGQEVGQFITGDWWVVGPVTIVSISPAASNGRNGSMVNPIPGIQQAYDDRLFGYTPSLLKSSPFILRPGESLVSSISLTSLPYMDLIGIRLSDHAYLKNVEILTCLSTPPPADAFRPPYIGVNKTIYRGSTIRWDELPSLSPAGTPPSLMEYKRYFERPWIDHLGNWPSREMHPADNMPNYGREIAGVVGNAALLLCLDYSRAEKEKLAFGLIQVGIDNFTSAVLNKDLWEVDGGHQVGRKLPILFAGKMLGNDAMLSLKDYKCSEDTSTYYGTSAHNLWNGWQNSGHPYAKNVLYLYENGIDDKGNTWNHENYHPQNWGSTPFPNNSMSPQWPYDKHEAYRRTCSYTFPAQALAARILNLKMYWAHDAFFDYTDRWMYEDDAAYVAIMKLNWPNSGCGSPYAGGTTWRNNFPRDMYIRYRPNY